MTSKAVAVSIIIPLYRAEQYIEECLESILAQKFDSTYEVIVVDDCTDDSSAVLVQNYQRNNPDTISLIANQTNRGVSATRNRALDAASGDYFLFVDSDDYLPQGGLQALHNAAITANADVVQGNSQILNETGCKAVNYNVKRRKSYRDSACLNQLLLHNEVRGHSWGKLYRSATCLRYRFDESISMTEDLRYCAEIFSRIDRLVLIPEDVYCYRDRCDGITGKKYINGAYIQWLETLSLLDAFVKSRAQKRSCKRLQVRAMLQILKESRTLEYGMRGEVVDRLQHAASRWGVSASRLLKDLQFGPNTWFRYFQIKVFMRQLTR